jgi:cytidylate kinase
MKKIIIAIDGVSSTGKSTMAKDLARELGYIYIDTGAMYRAVTLFSLRNNCWHDRTLDQEKLEKILPEANISFKLNPETHKPETYLNGENVEKEIRGMAVASLVSSIAAVGFVRRKLVSLQQEMGKEKGIVMDGRDIGTVVFPNAELKVYVTASPEVRAKRRFDELAQKGETASLEAILENVRKRDEMDMNREESPLRMADDALLLDNSNMSVVEQKNWLLEQYNNIISKEG